MGMCDEAHGLASRSRSRSGDLDRCDSCSSGESIGVVGWAVWWDIVGGQRGRAWSGSAMADADRPGVAAHADGSGDVEQVAPGDLSRGRPSPAQARASDAAGRDASMLAAGALYLPIPYSAFERKCDWYFYGVVRV